MDPGTILSVISLCTQLAGAAARAASGLHDLRTKFSTICRTVDLLMPQVNALRAAMDEMSRWLEGNQSVFCSRQIYFDNLHSSIKACCLVIEEIEAHLQKVHQCPDFKNKCKFLWKDEQIKEWQKLLDSQVSAFSLHLAVLRLNSPLEQQSLLDSPSAKDILDKARDDATSFTQRRRSHSGDAGSSSKSGMMRSRNKRFIFDGELLRSKPYRKVTEALHRRGSPVDDLSSSDGQKSSDAADMAVGTRGQVVGSSHASAIGDIHETESIHESLKSQVEGHHEASQNGLMSHDLQPTGRNDCLDYIPQPAAFHESNTRSVSNEHISSETNPLSRFNTTGTSDLQDENYTPLTSVDQCTEPLPNSGLATVYERPKAKLLVEVEIEDVGKEHLGLEDFGNDLLNDVYNVIGTLRNRLLQRAELEPPELVLVRQCLLAKSADGAHSVALTKLFLLGVIDEVGKGNYWDPTVSIKYAVDRPHPNVLALQSVVCKELNESAIQMEAGPLIPHDRLQSTLSIERVSALVSDDGVLSILNMNQVATIHEQGLKILAALILAETNLINVIRTNGTAFFVDSRLPLSLDHGSQGCLDPVAHHTVCQIQWHVMPALVQTRRDGQGAWPKYDKAQILPFISQTWIASGGFGAVYEVQLHKAFRSAQTFSHVDRLALKELHITRSTSKRFAQELAMLEQIREHNHQHIVELIGAYQHGDSYNILFPLARMSLRDMIESTIISKSEAVFSWAAKQSAGLANALHILHSHVCFHGDIKPENILVFDDMDSTCGKWVLSDFGLATPKFLRSGAQKNTVINSRCRTKLYSPPQYFPSYGHSPRVDLENEERSADIWAFGCILAEICCWLVGRNLIHKSGASKGHRTAAKLTATSFFSYSHGDILISSVALQGLEALLRLAILPANDLAFASRACLTVNAKSRPTAKQLQMLLQSIDYPGTRNMFGDLVHISAAPLSKRALDLVQAWRSDCLHHQACQPKFSEFSPEYLLDLVSADGKIRLVGRPDRASIRYVCLSYTWGDVRPLQLTCSSHELWAQGMPEQDLSYVFQDACQITRVLGERYLWIDALCINQDDPVHKSQQISQMADIFRNSLLTIVAASSESCDDSFLHRSHGESLILRQPVGTKDRIPFPTSHLHSNSHAWLSTQSSRWFRRAWTLQEIILPTRCLIFDRREMQWACTTCLTCECTRGIPTDNAFWHPRSLLDSWHAQVEEFSKRQLTHQTDKLAACAGLADTFAKRRLWTYAAGLWVESIRRDLCWTVEPSFEDSRSPGMLHAYIAPSWSWASLTSAIKFHDVQYWRPEVLRIRTSPDPHNRFGSVNSASLVLRTPLLQAVVDISPAKNGEIAELRLDSQGNAGICSLMVRYYWDCPVSAYDHFLPNGTVIRTAKRSKDSTGGTLAARSVFVVPLQSSPKALFMLISYVMAHSSSFERLGVAVSDGSLNNNIWDGAGAPAEVVLI